MQIDHIHVDDGENLHGHTRRAGVPVGQHFGVCVQGTAVETETRNGETETAIPFLFLLCLHLIWL